MLLYYIIFESTHSDSPILIFKIGIHSSSRHNRYRAVEWPLLKVSGGPEKLLRPWGLPLHRRTEVTILQVRDCYCQKMEIMVIELHEEDGKGLKIDENVNCFSFSCLLLRVPAQQQGLTVN